MIMDPITVKVRISADQARYVKERRWAAKQTIVEHEDGSLTLVEHEPTRGQTPP